jgi:hypothetical protein
MKRQRAKKATGKRTKPKAGKPSRAELERRIGAARAEISASLFFLVPPDGRHPRARAQLVYLLDNQIKNLANLAEALGTGGFWEETCEGCGKPIKPSQDVVRGAFDDVGAFHAKCIETDCGYTEHAPTIAQQNREIDKRIVAARTYLKRRGMRG